MAAGHHIIHHGQVAAERLNGRHRPADTMGGMLQGIMLVVVLAANNASQMPSNAMFLQQA
jgi:hypothetical protein